MSFNPFAFISQPLLLTIAQWLGVAPQLDIPTEIPIDSGDGLTNTQKAALIAVLGSVGLISTGIAIAADKLSNTRITISELQREPKGTIQRIEEFVSRNKKGITAIGALLLLGGVTAIYSQFPPPENAILPPWEDPTRTVSNQLYEACIDQQLQNGRSMAEAHAYCCGTISPLPNQCLGGNGGVIR